MSKNPRGKPVQKTARKSSRAVKPAGNPRRQRSPAKKSTGKLLIDTRQRLLEMVCPGWEREHSFHWHRRWRFDYACPAAMIAVEIEGGVWTGGRHTRGKGFLRDIEKYNEATAMGWRVFRCDTSDGMFLQVQGQIRHLLWLELGRGKAHDAPTQRHSVY